MMAKLLIFPSLEVIWEEHHTVLTTPQPSKCLKAYLEFITLAITSGTTEKTEAMVGEVTLSPSRDSNREQERRLSSLDHWVLLHHP